MTNRLLALAAASALAAVPFAALAQSATGADARQGVSPAAPATSPGAATTDADEDKADLPGSATSTSAAPSMNTTTSSGATSGAVGTSAAAQIAAGLSVKDNTGVTVGSISEVRTDAKGDKLAVIKMGEQSFSVAASSLAVRDGAAVINLSHAQINDMVKQAAPAAGAAKSGS